VRCIILRRARSGCLFTDAWLMRPFSAMQVHLQWATGAAQLGNGRVAPPLTRRSLTETDDSGWRRSHASRMRDACGTGSISPTIMHSVILLYLEYNTERRGATSDGHPLSFPRARSLRPPAAPSRPAAGSAE